MTFKAKFLEYFELIDMFRKGIMNLFFGPKKDKVSSKGNIEELIHSGDENSKYCLSFSSDHSVAKLKTASKKLGCTVNDLMLGVVGSSVSEYMNARNIPLKQAAIDVVWNLKEPP